MIRVPESAPAGGAEGTEVGTPPPNAGISDHREREDRAHGARGAGTNFLTLAGQTSLLLFQILGARLFGPATWGAYAFGLSALDVCGRLGLVGVDKGLLIFVPSRRTASDAEGVESAVATGIRISLVMGGILAVAVFALSGVVADFYGKPTFGQALRRLAPAIPLATLTTVLVAATMSLKTLRYNLLVKGVTEPFLRIGLVASFGLLATGIGALALVHVLAAVGTAAVAVFAFSRMFSLARTIRGVIGARLDGQLVRYAVPLALAEFVNSFLAQTNILVLGKFRPAEDVGIYGACLALSTAVSFVRGAFDTVLAPIAAEAWVERDYPRLARNLKLYSRVILIFVIPLCGLMVVGGPALLGLHGPGFVRGRLTLAILALGHVINASFGLSGWIIMASGRSKTVLFNNGLALAINIAVCFLLVPRLGMAGAALAATLTISVLQALQAVEGHLIARAHPLSPGFVRLVTLGALVIGLELGAHHLLGGGTAIVGSLLPVVIGAAVFFALAWLSGSDDERVMLAGMMGRGLSAKSTGGVEKP